MLNYLLPSRAHWVFVRKYLVGKIIRLMPKAIRDLHEYAYFVQRKAGGRDPETIENLYKLEYIIPEKYAQQRKEFTGQQRGYCNNDEVFQAMGLTIRNSAVSAEKAPAAGAIPKREGRQPDDPFTREFFELTEKYNIKVILILPYEIKPEEQEGVGTETRIPRAWEALQGEYENIYFSKDAYQPKYYEPELFRDELHLTPQGARRYTLEIAREFKEIVNKLDKLNAASYSGRGINE